MGLLESVRQGFDSTGTRILVGVVAFAFIFWGSGSRDSADASIHAKVNGNAITDAEFKRAYRMFDQGRDANRSEADEREFARSVLDQLIAEEALLQEADRLGFVVSAEEIARSLRGNPNFQKEGAFDEKTYQKVLKGMGMTAERFELEIQRQLLFGRLSDLAASSVTVSDADVRRAWLAAETQVDLTFIRLPRQRFLAEVSVPDADRDAFIAANGDKLDARYKDAYDRSYNLPKRFTLSTILLRTDMEGADKDATRAKAEEIRAMAATGDFAALARQWSEDLSAEKGGSLGEIAADQLDPVVASAADATAVGALSGVVETGRGYQILRVDAKVDARVIPFEEAKPAIAEELIREQKVAGVVAAYATQIIEAWKTADAPPIALTEARQLAVDSTGAFPLAAEKIPVLGSMPMLSAILAAAPTGTVLPTPFTAGDNTFVVAVSARTELDTASFDIMKGMVRVRVENERLAEFIEVWKADVIARAKVERIVRQ